MVCVCVCVCVCCVCVCVCVRVCVCSFRRKQNAAVMDTANSRPMLNRDNRMIHTLRDKLSVVEKSNFTAVAVRVEMNLLGHIRCIQKSVPLEVQEDLE